MEVVVLHSDVTMLRSETKDFIRGVYGSGGGLGGV